MGRRLCQACFIVITSASTQAMTSQKIHLYCTIIDNYGDIGVCWRLARQWVNEYHDEVHLWVDHWAAAQQLIRELPDAPTSENPTRVNGVVIRPWSHVDATTDCTGDVLIEGFGLTLPDATLAQLAARVNKPVWINLDYFSAEEWVERFHLQSGTDSTTKARRWFFFPGVQAHSGGILRERDLLAQRDAWLARGDASAFLTHLGVDVPQEAFKVLCFAYEHAPYPAWLDALATRRNEMLSIWLAGTYTQAAFAQLNCAAYPNVQMHNLPFVSQPDFDRLLWSADVLWVRGEDSLARALWSGKPFVWHIYPQAENVHHAKLAAWLTHYTQPFPEPLRAAYIELHEAWNGVTPASTLPTAWAKLMRQWADWQTFSHTRSNQFAQTNDLASRLISFIRTLNSSTQTYT